MKLIILQGDHQMETPLDEASMVIGRSSDADIQISDQGISRQHLRVEVDGDRLVVTDLGSRNGFKVRGSKVREATLDHNEEFSIGDMAFVFQTHDDELPGASLPNDDVTPMDAEFISTDEDHAAVPAEDIRVPAVKAVPVRGIVPAPPGAPASSGGGMSAKNKKFLVMASIPVLVILIAVIAGPGDDNGNNQNQNQNNNQANTMGKREKYIQLLEESLEPFEEYFNAPSNKASRLAIAIGKIDEALGINMGRAKLAPSIETVYKSFEKVGHDHSMLDDAMLYDILEGTELIGRDRLATHKIKSLFKDVGSWADQQLIAFNAIQPLRDQANARDPEVLIRAHQDTQNLERGTIYDSSRDKLEKQLYDRIGDVYLARARESLAAQDTDAAREDLAKAKNYGRQAEADRILSRLDNAEQEQENFDLAQKAFDEDDLDLAENLLEKFDQDSPLWTQVEVLQLKIDRRRLSIQLRALFTEGDETKLRMVARTHKLAEDSAIRSLIAQFDTTIDHYKRGLKAFEDEDYTAAKSSFYDAYSSISRFDKTNFYKIDSKRYLEEELTPERLSVKHYDRAKKHIERRDNVEARKELDIARAYDPIIGDNEIRDMVDQARDLLRDHLRIKATGTKSEVKESLDKLKVAFRWLRNTEPNSEEGRLYEQMRSTIR